MYLHDEGDTFGFHARMLAAGVLSFERRMVATNGATSADRKTTFLLELIDPSLRVYFLGQVFCAVGVNLGMAFYDGLVPTLDFQGGLGFQYHGWGLESGVRSSRLPHDATFVQGKEFVRSEYGAQLYVDFETNLPW